MQRESGCIKPIILTPPESGGAARICFRNIITIQIQANNLPGFIEPKACRLVYSFIYVHYTFQKCISFVWRRQWSLG